ncbi:MAG: iron ABC transporter permease [Paludibacteraceae bacterium]|nr:iron ABC transporter permease [Paludibacteraceae bacterium]
MKKSLIFVILFVLCFLFFLADLVLGSVYIPFQEIFEAHKSIYYEILYNFRLPKAITAVVTGAAISLSGLLMQTLFRNPLAGPYVLGVSSGAGLGVAVYILASTIVPIALLQSGWGLVIAAIIGASVVLMLVLLTSFRVKSAVSLLLIGLMFGQISGAVVSLLQSVSDPDSLKLYVTWTFGDLSAVSWRYMQVMLPIVLVGFMMTFSIQKPLDGLLLGENYAKGLGISIIKTRIIIIISITLLAGAVTAFTGPIAFVGIAVPHIARGIFRTSVHREVIPATMLIGAVLLLLCDIITQLPYYTPLPINAVSAMIGAPMIIWIILKNRAKA